MVVNILNGLPNEVVFAEILSKFKNSLDCCWKEQELYMTMEQISLKSEDQDNIRNIKLDSTVFQLIILQK
jgi:hypothetical protein